MMLLQKYFCDMIYSINELSNKNYISHVLQIVNKVKSNNRNEVLLMKEIKWLKNKKVFVSVTAAVLITLIVGSGIHNFFTTHTQSQTEMGDEIAGSEKTSMEPEDLSCVEETNEQSERENRTKDHVLNHIVSRKVESDPIKIMYQQYYDKLTRCATLISDY